MEPTRKLLTELEAEDRRQTAQMTPWQKFCAGGDLFDEACRWTLAGIKRQYPHFTEQQAMEELRRRIEGAEAREWRQ